MIIRDVVSPKKKPFKLFLKIETDMSSKKNVWYDGLPVQKKCESRQSGKDILDFIRLIANKTARFRSFGDQNSPQKRIRRISNNSESLVLGPLKKGFQCFSMLCASPKQKHLLLSLTTGVFLKWKK